MDPSKPTSFVPNDTNATAAPVESSNGTTAGGGAPTPAVAAPDMPPSEGLSMEESPVAAANAPETSGASVPMSSAPNPVPMPTPAPDPAPPAPVPELQTTPPTPTPSMPPKEPHKGAALLLIVIVLAAVIFAGWWFYIR